MLSFEAVVLDSCKGGGRCFPGRLAPYVLLDEVSVAGNDAPLACDVDATWFAGCADPSTPLKLASKGLKEGLEGMEGDSDSAGVDGD